MIDVDESRAGYALASWLFLRLLGLIYLIAFASLAVQVIPLLGAEGLLPAAELFEGPLAERWSGAIWVQPTLFHAGHSDLMLRSTAWLGLVIALLLMTGVAPGPCALALWGLYLSFVVVGRDFFGFQWDNLLLEAGALAVFLAPWRPSSWKPAAPWRARPAPPPRLVLFLFYLLLFRLNFESGVAKLLTGDPTWRDWTAMDYYYETAPLPTRLGWHVHNLPHGFHAFEVAATFVIELAVPFAIFAPRFIRRWTFIPLVGAQAVIGLTANYGFFNYLSAALCVFLLDDDLLQRAIARVKRLRRQIPGAWAAEGAEPDDEAKEPIETQSRSAPREERRLARLLKKGTVLVVVVLLCSVYYVEFARAFLPPSRLREEPSRARRVSDGLIRSLEPIRGLYVPFRSINRYHLFASMTTRRIEVVLQGSADGEQWRTYEFKHKPGDPRRAPDFVAPHQPRLDFQCWFLLLGPADLNRHPYFVSLLNGLLEGTPEARSFFAVDPFGDEPPRWVRVQAYRYTMTSRAERREKGIWWNREFLGQWGRNLSLRERR